MIAIGTGAAVGAGAVLALLIAAAGWALATGLGARARAEGARRDRRRLAELLSAAPAQPVLIHADGGVEMSARVAGWLGLDRAPGSLHGLTSGAWGMAADDAAALAQDINAARVAARGFHRVVRTHGETLMAVEGERRGEDVICWFADATAHEAELAGLRAQGRELSDALDAVTGLVAAAPLPMWYRGHDLRLAVVNAAYAEAVEGGDTVDVVRRGTELIEGSSAGGPLTGARAALESGEPQARVLPATIAGARRQFRVHDVPLADGGVAGFAIDVEELEQARGREKRVEAAQRAMLDRLSAGVAQFARDRSLVFCNQPFRRMFAMRREWLADSPAFERVLERMREAGRLPEVRDFPAWRSERRDWFTRAEGAIEESWQLPGGTHLRVVAQALPDGGMLLIFEDRTEQVQLASARDTLLRVRTATFDNLFEALGVFSADGRLQLWNSRFSALWGLDDEFLAAHPRVDVLAEQVAPRLANPQRARFIAELVRHATAERKQRAGRVALADGRHFEFAAVPLPDGNALFTMLDISDSRRIEQALRDRNEALEAADRVKTAFVANMSYELRTPLTSIGGFAEMLHGGYAGPLTADAQGYVGAILDSVERLGVLVDDVLDLTQSGNGRRALERDDMELGPVAREAAETVRAGAQRHGVRLAVEIDRSAGRLQADRRRIREVIEHLLRHAIGGVQPGGRVLLHVDGSAREARIVVSDDGAGMTADEVARAFDRFAQDGITPTGERALGLGLPLARQFVEAHGGTLTLVSEPGAGSLLTATVPRR